MYRRNSAKVPAALLPAPQSPACTMSLLRRASHQGRSGQVEEAGSATRWPEHSCGCPE